MKRASLAGSLIALLSVTAFAQSTYTAKQINVTVRDMGGSYSVKIPAGQKKTNVKQRTERVEWKITSVPRGARVRIAFKQPDAPPAACFPDSATSWQCISSAFFLDDDTGAVAVTTPPAAAPAGAKPAAKPAAKQKQYEYDLILTVGGKEYRADPFIIVNR